MKISVMDFVSNKCTFKVAEMVKSFKYYGATDHNKERQIRGACWLPWQMPCNTPQLCHSLPMVRRKNQNHQQYYSLKVGMPKKRDSVLWTFSESFLKHKSRIGL